MADGLAYGRFGSLLTDAEAGSHREATRSDCARTRLAVSAAPDSVEVPAGDFRGLLGRADGTLLRLPSRRPQKGRQAVRDVSGKDGWAGADVDFDRAVAFTPAAFTWNRAKSHLVELPAIWVKIPLADRDGDELGLAVGTVLRAEGCPAPHLVVEGDRHLFVVWAIEPLRRPAKAKPEAHHFAYRKRLEDWRRAVIKLSFALEPLGCRPLDVATADELLCDFIPLPMVAGSLLHDALGLHDDPPRVVAADAGAEISAPSSLEPIVIAEISKPLGRFDGRMFATLGVSRPRGRKQWLKTAVSLAALEPKGPGQRHPAAVKIACAAVWDGENYEQVVDRLRAWTSTCVKDGAFPFHRAKGDELELLAAWAVEKLKPGGPDKVRLQPHQQRRTTTDAVAAAVCGFLRAVAGEWSGSKLELAKQAALWALEQATTALCPRTTVKRALDALKRAGELIHDVVREGRTWRSTWRLAQHQPQPEAPSSSQVEIADSGVQRGKSTWAPGLFSSVLPHRGGAAGGMLPPAGGVQGGAEPLEMDLPDPKAAKNSSPPGDEPADNSPTREALSVNSSPPGDEPADNSPTREALSVNSRGDLWLAPAP